MHVQVAEFEEHWVRVAEHYVGPCICNSFCGIFYEQWEEQSAVQCTRKANLDDTTEYKKCTTTTIANCNCHMMRLLSGSNRGTYETHSTNGPVSLSKFWELIQRTKCARLVAILPVTAKSGVSKIEEERPSLPP
jgi:hypothetical protein